jgi:hypothetical protein
VVFDSRIRDAFAMQLAAGEAKGQSEALEAAAQNIDNQEQVWRLEAEASEDETLNLVRTAQADAARSIRDALRGEASKRKQHATLLRQQAEMALGGAARQICGL